MRIPWGLRWGIQKHQHNVAGNRSQAFLLARPRLYSSHSKFDTVWRFLPGRTRPRTRSHTVPWSGPNDRPTQRKRQRRNQIHQEPMFCPVVVSPVGEREAVVVPFPFRNTFSPLAFGPFRWICRCLTSTMNLLTLSRHATALLMT